MQTYSRPKKRPAQLTGRTVGPHFVLSCPCTPEALCQATAEANLPIFNRFCDMPRAPITTYSMHGGAGGIMSIGLMRKVRKVPLSMFCFGNQKLKLKETAHAGDVQRLCMHDFHACVARSEWALHSPACVSLKEAEGRGKWS